MTGALVLKAKQKGGGWYDALHSPALLEGCGCKLERGQEVIQQDTDTYTMHHTGTYNIGAYNT